VVEVDKSVTKTLELTVDLKWIDGETEPESPEGYVRTPEFDIDLGLFGHWWAFMKVS